MTYDDPVVRALRERGLGPVEDPKPPEGRVRYHVAVEENQHDGVAPPATVAAILRDIANQLTKENSNG